MYMDEERFDEGLNEIQNLKTLLTEILSNNSAYDCMPVNSSINSIDKNMTLYDAINVLMSKELEELLVWDQQKSQWIWMLTLVDAIRFIIHALKSVSKRGYIDFSDFQKEKQKGLMVSEIYECSKEQLNQVIKHLEHKQISTIISEITLNSPVKNYIRLKSVSKESKIAFVILAMTVEKIHRILVEDEQSHMLISVLNFKDIFLYLLGIANQSNIPCDYGAIGIQNLLQSGELRKIFIDESRPLWQAFEIMVDRQKSLWISVVDSSQRFKGMLFREDFRQIFQGWHFEYLWLSVGEFLHWKKASQNQKIPEYRYFDPSDNTKDILWKMIMSKRNLIIWVDSDNKIQAIIGLMQIFRLYLT